MSSFQKLQTMISFGCFLLTALTHLPVAAQQSNSQPQWRMEFKNGRVQFARITEDLPLKTGFGRALIENDKIRKIVFKTSTELEVHTSDGTVLKGSPTVNEFKTVTDGKESIVAFTDLAKVSYLSFAPPVSEIITDGIASNGMTYHVRAPKDFDLKKKYPAIVILHGSNMNSKMYVGTIASRWPELANRYLLIGINGEKKSSNFSATNPRYNYTYVNFAGKSKYKGFPGSDRESPALVNELLLELKRQYKMEKIFVGGHSQGGFLTYSLAMNYPELIDGAFPISAGMIVQCEPAAYEDKHTRNLQRTIPIAIVHAPNDKVVKYSMATYAFEKLIDDGFTQVKLLENDGAHMFAMLPVDQAIQWLEEMTSDDPQKLLVQAKKAYDAEAFRIALAILKRLEKVSNDDSVKKQGKAIQLDIQTIAKVESRKLVELIKENKNRNWVDRYKQFQQQFRTTAAGQSVVEEFLKLREKHERHANRLFNSAIAILMNPERSDQKDEAYLLLQEIIDQYYASTRYETAKTWIKNRTK